MKYSLFLAALFTFFLVGCGEPKPGQYPPSMMEERGTEPGSEPDQGGGQ